MSEEFLLTLRITSTKVPGFPCRYNCIVIEGLDTHFFFSSSSEVVLYIRQTL